MERDTIHSIDMSTGCQPLALSMIQLFIHTFS